MSGLDRIIEQGFAGLSPEYVEGSKRVRGSLATEADGMDQPGIRFWLEAFGVRDVLTVMSVDASGVGAIVIVNLAETAHAEARKNESLAQVAAHVLGAYHLREESPNAPEAVFHASGELLESSQEIREADTFSDLTSAVRALGTLRNASSNEARALGTFTSRVDATWSVLAEVTDGSHEWIVARRNAPPTLPLPETLTQRERQVMTLLLLGRTPKLAAYELGIAHSTVRVLVSRALGKLGATTVNEVLARFAVTAES